MRRLAIGAPQMQTDNLPYRIEIWSRDGRVREETLAACSNFYVATAAFTEAVTRNPKSHVMLCERSRIISVHKPK
jgi:hypothetical protein